MPVAEIIQGIQQRLVSDIEAQKRADIEGMYQENLSRIQPYLRAVKEKRQRQRKALIITGVGIGTAAIAFLQAMKKKNDLPLFSLFILVAVFSFVMALKEAREIRDGLTVEDPDLYGPPESWCYNTDLQKWTGYPGTDPFSEIRQLSSQGFTVGVMTPETFKNVYGVEMPEFAKLRICEN